MGAPGPADGAIGEDMPRAHATASTLEAAFDSGDEDRLVEELRLIASRKSRRQPRIALAMQLLERTGSPRVRNAAALALADMRAPGAKDVLIEVLRRPETRGCRGTLLYAAGQLAAALPIGLLADLIAEDSYEAREEALHFLANEKFDWDEDPRQIRRKLRAALDSADAERSQAINAALEYLTGDGSVETRGAEKAK